MKNTQVIKLNCGTERERAIRKAAHYMHDGKIVVFPTDTVYGIGTNALDARACSKVYKIKGREKGKALIILASDMRMLDKVAVIPKEYRAALKQAWPAPLTVIAKPKKCVPRLILAPDGTTSVRIPDNDTTLALIRYAKVPVVAPSANPSGLEPSKTAMQASNYFNGKVDLILDAGRSARRKPSTILRLSDMQIVRKGAFQTSDVKRLMSSNK